MRLVSSFDVSYVLAYGLPVVMFVYASFWAFSVRHALRVRLYRNQALGIGLVALTFAIFLAVLGVPPDVYNTNYPLISDPFYYFSFLVTFFWIDSSMLAARRSDPLLRDSFHWRRLRIVLWAINILGAVLVLSAIAYLQITVGNIPAKPPLIALIFLFLPFYLTILSGGVFLPILARRSKDPTLRRHLLWFGLFAISLAVFLGAVGQLLDNSLRSFMIENTGVILGGFFLYMGAKSLVPLNRISKEGRRLSTATVAGLTLVVILGLSMGILVASPALYATNRTDVSSSSTLYFTIVGDGVDRVSFHYDVANHSFSLGTPEKVVSSLPGGADGLVFDPFTGFLLVGVNAGGKLN